MQATLNRQIIKWFQNNSFTDRKLVGLTKPRLTNSSKSDAPPDTQLSDNEDESETFDDMMCHIAELERELKNPLSNWDVDKVARLLSVTYGNREASTCPTERGSHTRMSRLFSSYPCLKQPIFVSSCIIIWCTVSCTCTLS